MSTRKQVVKATSFIMGITILAKIVGFVREQVIAHQFGATGITDAYVSAQLIPNVFTALIGSTISMALLPVFTGYIAAGKKKEGWQIAGNVLALTFFVLLVVSVLGILLAPILIRALVPNMPGEYRGLAIELLRIMFPSIIFLSLAVIGAILLNAYQRFVIPALSPIVTNTIVISAIIIFSHKYGIYGLAWGTLVGMSAQFFWLLPFLRKVGWQWRPHISLHHPAIREVAGIAWPLFLAGILTQLSSIIEKVLGSGLTSGSISALYYGAKLVQLPVGIFVTAVTTVVFPTLARYAAEDNRPELLNSLFAGLRIMIVVALPAAVGLMVLRVPIVRLAFERGAFDRTATLLTAGAILYYAFGILGTAGVQILSRTFYALKDSKTPLLVSLFSALLYFLTAEILVRLMAQRGLALANSVGLLFNAGVLYFLALRVLGKGKHREFMAFLGKAGSSAAVMGLAVYFSNLFLAAFGLIIALGVSAVVGVLVYGAAIICWRLEEVDVLTKMVRKRIGIRG